MATTDLTAARLRALFHYDPETGKFRRLVHRGPTLSGAEPTRTDRLGYLIIKVDYHQQFAHRLAWLYVYGHWPMGHIDHINGNPADNRIANLRDVSRVGNMQNTRSARVDNITGILGVGKVVRHGKTRYMSQIQANGARHFLGIFDSAEEAHRAYLDAKRRLHSTCTI